jgi:lipid A 3-O-deacylase
MPIKSLIILLSLISLPAFSQSDTINHKTSDRKFLSTNYDNDFFTATDRYYTQGIKFELVLPAFKKLPLMFLLPKLSHSTVQYGLSAVQDCFTPASIRRDTFIQGDRPYAATMYLGHFAVSNNEEKKQRFTSEIDLGIIGPCAVCEEEQKGIHKSLLNIQPLGWEAQVKQDILINYRMRYEKNIFAHNIIDLNALGEINAGTIYDNAAIGANLRIGKKQAYFENARSKKFYFYAFAQGWLKGVAYNATMQGGVFNKTSDNVVLPEQIQNAVVRGSFGLCLTYKKIALEYSYVFISREITAWLPHAWGHLNIVGYF